MIIKFFWKEDKFIPKIIALEDNLPEKNYE